MSDLYFLASLIGVFKGPITLDDLALNSSNLEDLLFKGVLSPFLDPGIFGFSIFCGENKPDLAFGIGSINLTCVSIILGELSFVLNFKILY
jgi:hypothetical protein